MNPAEAIQNAVHDISQALLQPTMVVLIALAAYAVWCVGSILTELLTDRRRYRADMADALAAISACTWAQLPDAIRSSGLLRRHKELLLELARKGAQLDSEGRLALAMSLMSDAEAHYSRIVTRMDLVAKVAPMIGLMGTLIPLGPGITAMNEGDLQTLSSSLNIAFDTTVVGLVAAAVALTVVRFRRHWYEEYLVRIEAMFTAMLAKADRECSSAAAGGRRA